MKGREADLPSLFSSFVIFRDRILVDAACVWEEYQELCDKASNVFEESKRVNKKMLGEEAVK